MSEKRYPTRMHEVLGVAPGERFQIKGQTPWYDKNFYVDENGDVRREGWSPPVDRAAVYLINNPERITRLPRLTEEQVAMLKAAWTLGARYIAREGNSGLRLSDNAPLVLMGGRLKITDDSLTMYIESYGNPLVELVKQSDPAPLDILQVMRQNGVEVEG